MGVSVLLPVRNGAGHLDEALSSLAGQTFRDFEVLAVDDGSDDETPEILEAWARRDCRVRVLRQEPAGIVAALERARAAARAPYLARMDADDVAAPERLERQLELLEARPGLVACGSGVTCFPREALTDGALRYESWINALVTPDEIERDLFVECPLPHPTFFLRAEAVEDVGGYRDRGWPEDYDLLLRLWAAGGRFGKVDRRLLRWRESPARLSRTSDAYSAEAFRRCKVHFLVEKLLPDPPAAVVWGAGPTGKAFGRSLRAAGATVRAWVEVDPRKVGQEIHGAPVVTAEEAGGYTDALHLAAVAQPGAREEIRARFRDLELAEITDAVAVA